MSEPIERWAPVPGRAGYEASDFGRIRFNGDVQKQTPANGYMRVTDKVRKGPVLVHTLVLTAFSGPRLPGKQTRHLNGDGFDNRLENLKWGTAKENSADRVLHDQQRDAGLLPASRMAGRCAVTVRQDILSDVDAFAEADWRSRTNAVQWLVACALQGRDPFRGEVGLRDRYEAARAANAAADAPVPA